MTSLLIILLAWGLLTNPRQALIALDQWLGTCIPGGMADETLSARAFRECLMQDDAGIWYVVRDLIDALFWLEPDHCRQSWLAEWERRQYPSHYTRDADHPRVLYQKGLMPWPPC